MKTVALCEGINSEEVINLLKIVFNVTGNIVGIMAEVTRLFCFVSTKLKCNYFRHIS